MPRILLFGFAVMMMVTAQAQEHAFPVDGGLGEPGPNARSFIVGWHQVPGAVGYEYVMTDNFLCFSGCAGDTREAIVQDTFTIEYELLSDKQYYWVTRVHFENGETGPWSLISEFWSWTPPVEPILLIAPNPVVGEMSVNLDWGANPDADLLEVTILNLEGKIVIPVQELRPASIIRKEQLVLEEISLPPGFYFIRIIAKANDGREFLPLVNKFQVRE